MYCSVFLPSVPGSHMFSLKRLGESGSDPKKKATSRSIYHSSTQNITLMISRPMAQAPLFLTYIHVHKTLTLTPLCQQALT